MKTTEIKMTVDPKQYRGFALDSFVKENADFSMENLAQMGITMDESIVENTELMKRMRTMAGDAADLVLGQASAVTPLQFAQFWLSEPINAIYQGRTAEKIFGSENVGTWETEQIVGTLLERTGKPALYDDFSKAPLANWNINFFTRDNIRFEMGVACTKLEEARAAQMRQNSYQMKRSALMLAMEMLMNQVKWFGYNDGSRKVYGILNDPALGIGGTGSRKTTAAYDPVATATTADNIISMLNTWIQTAASDLQGNWSPDQELVIVLPLAWQTAFTKINQYGISPKKWLAENYPRVRIEVAPELDKADDDGDPEAIVYVPQVPDVGKTISLMDTAKLRLIGAMATVKGFEESYSSSTAGALIRCPLAVRIYSKP